jgi:2-C-methyl-D-erythritol 4-phosphate cytidylyltransferase/2-C-methyl-D-erythritol 2,4-cyclodiphosphate synthase
MRRALAEAAAAGLSATDEVGLLLAAGLPVTCVAGDPSNWKITTPEDLSRARAALGERS